MSYNIFFASISHFPTYKSRKIFKALLCIYVFYLKRGFQITTVHANGEFSTMQELIAEILSGPMVNLMSANEHAPKIEWQIWVVKER